MTEYPLYDLVAGLPEPLSPMTEYLRDRNCPPGYVETRRKADLRAALTEFKAGKLHPILFLMRALDSTLISSRHAINHLSDMVRDQNSFKHMYGNQKKDGTEPSPEEFQQKRKAHIERLIAECLRHEHRKIPFMPTAWDAIWADEMLEALEQPDTKARVLVEQIAVKMIPSDSRFRWNELRNNLSTLRVDEEGDEIIHPNDAHINGDLLQVMSGYKSLDWNESSTRDQYQTQKAIELRRANEIVDALEAWKGGRHPLLVMSDILMAVVENLDHRYRGMIEDTKSKLREEQKARREGIGPERTGKNSEYYLVSLLLQQEDLRRKARDVMRQMHLHVVAYRGPKSNPEFAAAIDTFIQNLVDTPQSSFRILESIALAMFMDESAELAGIKADLREVEEREEKERTANAPMGKLTTQTEAEMKKPLAEIFAARAKPEQPPEKLTREIRIEPVGAGMIKPYPSGEDYDHWEEEIYGTNTAYISTYAVSFVPISNDKTEALVERVKRALEEIADVEPAFEIPFDGASKPYQRPYKYKAYQADHDYFSSESLRVVTEDNLVKVYTRLDLDDLWNLYYLLEDVIEPSQQIAAAMNAARYVEARGMMLTVDTHEGFIRNLTYSNRHLRPESRLGLLEYYRPENYVSGMMQDTFVMYAVGEIDDEQLLHRVIVLADHTLTGKLADPSGAFPSWQRLTSNAQKQGGAVATYGDALKDRVTGILRIMTGSEGNTSDLVDALKEKVREIGDDLRDKMRAEAHAREVRDHDRMMKLWSSASLDRRSLQDMFRDLEADFKERTGKSLSEAREEHKRAEEGGAETEEDQKTTTELAVRANLAFHAGEVGATTDRTWRGTKYVSRSPGSIWVRKDMPSSLVPFVTPTSRDMASVIQAIGLDTKIK